MAKKKYDINKIRLAPVVRKNITDDEVMLSAIRHAEVAIKELGKWLDENRDNDDYVITLEKDGFTTHLFCENDNNDAFPVVLNYIRPDMTVISMPETYAISDKIDEIKALIPNLNQSLIPEGFELKIASTVFLQKDRKSSFEDMKVTMAKLREKERQL